MYKKLDDVYALDLHRYHAHRNVPVSTESTVSMADVIVVVSNAIGLNVTRFSFFGFELMQSPKQQHRRRFNLLATRGDEQVLPIFFSLENYFSIGCFVQCFRILMLFNRIHVHRIFTIYYSTILTPQSLIDYSV